MELETLNKLYLELSHVATARSDRELELETLLGRARDLLGVAHEVACRDGQATNWPAFRATLRSMLEQIADCRLHNCAWGVSNLRSAISNLQSEDDHD